MLTPATLLSDEPLKVFLSYSHEDLTFRRRLGQHLASLKQEHLIVLWHDREIGAGTEWEGQIHHNLETADIILLLISASFMDSEYCSDVELKRAMARHENREARVIPILLRDCDWERAPFGKLQTLPTGLRPIARWKPQDQAYCNVAKGLRQAVMDLLSDKKSTANNPSSNQTATSGSLSSDGKKTSDSWLGSGKDAPSDSWFSNLPAQAFPLVGRLKEISRIKALLLQEDVRLLVLHGAPGTGKTRLAQHVAAELAREFKSGVCVVYLERVGEPELVPSAIVQALGLQEAKGVSVKDRLRQYLKAKQMLLLLDNFEHVTAAQEYLPELLADCGRLKILVTSRESLRGPGVYRFPVPRMALPTRTEDRRTEELLRFDAIQLFVERAQAANPSLAITADNALAIAKICSRLGGNALAIELAAARIRWLPLQKMLRELESQLDLCAGVTAGAPSKQQTMRATLDWSYKLLKPAGVKALFDRLSVFRKGFTLEAAARICKPPAGLKIDVAEGLASLVGSSLILEEERGRFEMLDFVREYGWEHLPENERSALAREHAGYFLALAEGAEKSFTSAERTHALERLSPEYANLRAAFEWSQTAEGERELGLRLAGALFWFWNFRSDFTEGRAWLAKVIGPATESPRTNARAKALYGAGGLAFLQGAFDVARPLIEESVAIWRELGDQRGLGFALIVRGMVALDQGHDDVALASEEESLQIFKELGDAWGMALAYNDLGNVLRRKRDSDAPGALKLYNKSLTLWRKVKDLWGLPLTLSNLGILETDNKNYEAATRAFEEALQIQQQVDDQWGLAETLKYMADLALKEEELTRAGKLYLESLTLNQKIGRSQFINACLEGLRIVDERSRAA
jgi:predicted ATPase